jgi:hypothetical protein
MAIRKGDEEKLADKATKDDQQRKDALPRPTPTEAKVMRQVKDTDIEGDN